MHCPHAFGVVLKAGERINSAGKFILRWKIVYLGDTRPCLELIEASRGAIVLIHEESIVFNIFIFIDIKYMGYI